MPGADGVSGVTPSRRTLTDAERLAALRTQLELGQSGRFHFFPGGGSFEHKGLIIRVSDEEIVRALLARDAVWEEESESPPSNLAVVERTRAYRADLDGADPNEGDAEDAEAGALRSDEDGTDGDGPAANGTAGDAPILR